jgi:SAM-dependent methyltransferase
MEFVDDSNKTAVIHVTNTRFYRSLPESVRRFVTEALPYSHFGQAHFNVRLMELALADSLFSGVFSRGGTRALDIGCGIGLAATFLSQHFGHVDGTDIDDIGVAFKVDRAAPLVGQELLAKAGVSGVSLHCGDTLSFLRERRDAYDFIFSHFVMEHIPDLEPVCDAIFSCLKSGGRTFHIVPNTHDTINQLLQFNLQPLWPNIARAWKQRSTVGRTEGRMQGWLFTPITHSEFLTDYSQQFEVNSSDHYLFPLIASGLRVVDIKPMREHAYGILAEKP